MRLKLIFITIFTIHSMGSINAQNRIPSSYSNLGRDAKGLYYQEDSLRYYSDTTSARYTLKQMLGDPKGTSTGIEMNFKNIEGTITYGLIPRVLSLLLAIFMTRRKVAAIVLDEGLPGYAELRGRLAPPSEKAGTDAPDGPQFQSTILPRSPAQPKPDQLLIAGIELAPDTPWPPAALPLSIIDLGVIDTRSQRSSLLDRMHQHPPLRMLAVCDPQQTPDRGTIALLAELAGLAAQAHIALPARPVAGNTMESRVSAWHERLLAAGFAPDQVHSDIAQALAWLAAAPQGENLAGAAHA